MGLDADTIIDRRRLRRALSFWRALAIFAIVAVVGAVGFLAGAGGPSALPGADQIARIPVTGTITDSRKLRRLIERVKDNDAVKGVVIAIDSPGGTTVGGETLYNALRELATEKPVVAQMGTLGTSAAYMAALAADHIVAHHTTITGSIGVLVQYGNVEDLLSSIGVTVDKVDSGPLKAEPSPFDPTSPEAIEVLQSIVDDSYAYFVGLVAERRGIAEPAARALADGRIYSGKQALDRDLIDEIGGEETAIAWLEAERGVAEDLPVKDWTVSSDDDLGLLGQVADRIAARLLAAVGLHDRGPAGAGVDPRFLDGLLSLWHGSGVASASASRETPSE